MCCPGWSSWSLAQNLWLTSTQQLLSYLFSISIQRKGLLEELRPGEAGQDLLDAGLGTGLSRFPPLPRPAAQPHLSTPSPGPEPRNATVQSNASLSSKLPDQPSWLLRTGIWHNRNQPQICRQPHCPEPGGWCWISLREKTGTLGGLTPIKIWRATSPLQITRPGSW